MSIKNTIIITSVAFALVGCASTPTETAEAKAETMAKTEAMAKTESMAKADMPKEVMKENVKKEKPKKKAKKKSSKKGLSKTVASSLTATHAAATAAMKQNGFEIKDSSDTVIAGKRPNKVGLAVGSGGEKMTITLTSVSSNSTDVHVKTKKTFVGIAGQKNWDDEIMDAIASGL